MDRFFRLDDGSWMWEVLNSPPLEGWRKFGRIFDGVVAECEKRLDTNFIFLKNYFPSPDGNDILFCFLAKGIRLGKTKKI